ncbi:Protein of unknown function [Pyronema omphalodes CBS 100304]|uniref:Uncharacterized protein n=1 Tax=Pyronema omphalodes (strain CBS 100304) TaxID=1076935 RepID=U4LFD2_PYROM|nr:Protein of unknown function [Pyronema omphalodes CBS 100304]
MPHHPPVLYQIHTSWYGSFVERFGRVFLLSACTFFVTCSQDRSFV